MDTQKLRQRILDLAIRGKLVPQDPNDEPASVLLDRIRAEKECLIAEGKIKRPKAKKSTDKSHYQNFTPPFDIPDSWQWVRLEDICTIKGGKRIPKGKGFSEIPTQHIYIRVTNMKSNTIISDDLKYIEEEVYKEIKNYTISKDDLYLTIAGTIGAVGIVPNELDGMNLTENAAKLTNILIDKEYLMYVLLSTASQDHFSSKFHQVAQPKLSIETASTTIIPVPPIAEQYRIVNNIKTFLSELHKLENGSRNLKQAIASVKAKILDLAMQGKLVSQEPTDEPAADMLRRVNPKAKIITDNPHSRNLPTNWILCRFGDIADISRGGSPRPIKSYITNDCNGINWIKIGDADGKYINSTKEKIIPAGVKMSREVKKGEILLTNSMSFGKPYILNINGCIHDGWLVLSPKGNSYDKDFLYYLLSSKIAYSQFAEQAGGAVVSNLNSDKVANTLFPLLSISEQQRIVGKIEELYSVLDEIEASLQS